MGTAKKEFIPPVDSNKWDVIENQNVQEFAKYLRKHSNGSNDWTWKGVGDTNLFFSPKGKIIAIVFYSGIAKMDTKTCLLKGE